MRVSTLIVAVFLLALAAPVSAQETLSLSRYRIRLEVIDGPSSDGQVIGSIEDDFARRCRDDDGCEVSIVITGINHAAVHDRIFFLENGTSWIGEDGSPGANPDFSADPVIAVASADVVCALWDTDTVTGGIDITDALSFSMASNLDGAQCTLTIID